MLVLEVPADLPAERQYAADVVLGTFLGLPFRLQPSERPGARLIVDERAEIRLPDAFFPAAARHWLNSASMPARPALLAVGQLGVGGAANGTLPLLFGGGEFRASEQAGVHVIELPVDVFGSAFFLLSRYEEAVVEDRDYHGRFPAAASCAARYGFIDRPLVDEYVDLLWAAIEHLRPNLRRRMPDFKQVVTCDVDTPFDISVRSPGRLSRRLAGDLLKRRAPRKAMETLRYAARVRREGTGADCMWNFHWMMDVCDRALTRCTFNFITAHLHPEDGPSYWGHPDIERLLREIHDRGHCIGLHASYTSYDDGERINAEFRSLRETCDRLGIQQTEWGGRQHYLRWRSTSTWRHWAAAGLDYDSTLGFADQPGFRCGTCRRYPVFDLSERRPLPLIEEPLIVMEVSLMSAAYMDQPLPRVLETALRYKAVCRRFGGDFTLLWHNSSLTTPDEREAYRQLIGSC